MATVMNPHHIHSQRTSRTVTQNVCVGMGIAFLVLGLAGLIMPGFLGMHLSMAHNLIHLTSGALALWSGYADETRKAYTFSIVFGSLYGLLGLAGFLIGEPGYPGVGNMEADQNLWRVITNVLEFGSIDHVIHLIISAVFLMAAYAWKKRHDDGGRGVVDVQRRSDLSGRDTYRSNLSNAQSGLDDADLGTSDINRRSDIDRRTNFESKL